MKKTLLLFFVFICTMLKAQTPISWYLMSQNGWRPDQVGGGTTPFDTNACPGISGWLGNDSIPCKIYGNIGALWPSVQASGAHFIRFGGISADQNRPSNQQYLNFVDSVRARGMEPILQIPLNINDYKPGSSYDTLAAKNIIAFINGTVNRQPKVYQS